MGVTGENSLLFKNGFDNSRLLKGKNEAVNIVSQMSSQIAKINPFLGFAIASTTAFAIISREAYKMAKEFEHAMKEVETISKATQENFDEIADKVFQISKISPDSPKELAEAYYQIVSAGYDGAEGLKLLELASKGATAGVTSTKVSADGLTTVMNAYKIGIEDAEQVSDIFFNTVKLGKTTFEELASNIATVAPLSSATGIAFGEVSSAIATLTKQGTPTAQAVTQIRASINALNENLTEGWAKSLTLQEGLQLLYEEADGSTSALLKLTGRVEGMSAVLGLAGDNLKSATADLESYKNVAGATAEAEKTLIGDSTNQWKLFSNNIRSITKNLGDSWLSVSTSLARGLNSLFTDSLDGSEKLKKSFDEQRTKVFELQGELSRLNVESDERKVLIEEMQKLFPDFIANIDKETVSNEELLSILDDVNESYRLRYKLQKRRDELNIEEGKQADIELIIEDVEDEFKQKLAKLKQIADDYGVKIKLDDPDLDFESIRKYVDRIEEADKKLVEGSNVRDTKMLQTANTLFSFAYQTETLNEKLSAQSEIVDGIRAKNDRLYKEDLANSKTREDAIRRISKALSVSDIAQYEKTGYDEITKAYKERVKIIEKLDAIQGIKKLENLKVYLASENAEIVASAQARQKALEVGIVDPDKKKDTRTEEKKFDDYLKGIETKYKLLETYKDVLGEESAKKRQQELSLEFDNWEDFLKNKLKALEGQKKKEDAIIRKYQESGLKINKIDTKALDSGIENVIEDIEKNKIGSNVAFDLDFYVQNSREQIARVEDFKKKSEERLALFQGRISKKAYDREVDVIEKKYKKLLDGVKQDSIDLLTNAPTEILDQVLTEMHLDFQTLNQLTLGQLEELESKVKELALDDAKLLELGLTKEEIKVMTDFLEKLKGATLGDVDSAEANKIADIFGGVGSVLSQAGDDLTRSVGEMALQLGNAISVFGDQEASTINKATSLVGLFVSIGELGRKERERRDNKEVNDQREIVSQLSEQLKLEERINVIRRERALLERNQSAFLDSYYKNDFISAINLQTESEERLNEAMNTLAKNGIFTAEGIGKRLLFGEKKKDFDFSMEQILGDYSIEGYYENGGLLYGLQLTDPLSIMGGYSDRNAQEDALNKMRKAFDETLQAMGKTASDMAQFSTEEWLDFYDVMEVAGHITDEATKSILDEARLSLEEYQQALEDMKSIINDFAGELGNNLGDSLVKAFQDGTDASEEFMNSINDVINRLFVTELVDSQFRKYFDELQKEMKSSFEVGGDQSWIDDIQRFAGAVTPAMEGAMDMMQTFNDEMQALGYDGFNSDGSDPNSLSGAIKNITEDTANVLAGTLNAIRIDVREGLDIAQDSYKELVKISDNTSHNKHLESINNTLINIETELST